MGVIALCQAPPTRHHCRSLYRLVQAPSRSLSPQAQLSHSPLHHHPVNYRAHRTLHSRPPMSTPRAALQHLVHCLPTLKVPLVAGTRMLQTFRLSSVRQSVYPWVSLRWRQLSSWVSDSHGTDGDPSISQTCRSFRSYFASGRSVPSDVNVGTPNCIRSRRFYRLVQSLLVYGCLAAITSGSN